MPDLLAAFTHTTRSGKGWTARCPGHDDKRNSLSIGRGDDGRWLLNCHAGCRLDAILSAAHLTAADLFVSNGNGRGSVTTYDYRDEHGALLYQVCRFEPKDFRLRAADGSPSIKGIRRVPYRLPELQGRRTVFVVEGEKDADTLWSRGLPATTNAGGQGKWRDEYTAMLAQAGCQHVIVLPDNDPPGETHGREVARSCVEAKLEVKLIPLPGLPPKGDVSDYLQHHSKEDLLAIVKDAPLFVPHRLVATPQPLTLTSLADFLDEPDDLVEWVVDSRIPAGSVVLFVAPPKAGKSTAARELACAVSRGEPWLGWPTSQGAVWLLIFEDKKSEVRKHLKRVGAAGTDPMRLFVGQAPVDLLPQLHELAAKERPTLIVVDTLARAVKVKDFNDYAMVTQGFEPLLKLTRTTGATLFLLYHSSVHVSRDGLDAVLGSTALSGSVDNILILKRADQQRVLSSVQRIGPDLEPTVIVLNPDTGRLERAGSKREFDDAELGQRIEVALAEPVSEKVLQATVEGRKADKVRILRRLVGMGRVRRFGAGGQKDPYRYQAAKCGSQCGSHETGAPKMREPHEHEFAPINSGLFDSSKSEVPEVPSYSREPKIDDVVRTHVRTSSSHVSAVVVPEVPEVPDTSETSRIGPDEMPKTPDKQASNCGSQPHDIWPRHGDREKVAL